MDKQYEIGRTIGLEIWLHNPYDMTEIAYYYFHPDEEMDKINAWVRKNQLGFRITLNSWKLKDQESFMMFMLKWAK